LTSSVDIHDHDLELNEVNWWSNWATVEWTTKGSYVILSAEFDEPFFNRGGFVTPDDAESAVRSIESTLRRNGRDPYIFLQKMRKYASVAKTLRKGYEIVDGMSVMELKTPSFKTNSEVRIEVVDDGNVREWCEAYLLAFYGDKKLIIPVERITRRIMRGKQATLLLARYRGATAGTTAIYRKGGLSGAYCVGTKPQFRNLRVATTLLEFVYSDSRDDWNRFVLQTMLSDEAESLYLKLGFKRVYLKQFFKRRS
jgi:GNAT superfamily N-acetyltransferase